MNSTSMRLPANFRLGLDASVELERRRRGLAKQPSRTFKPGYGIIWIEFRGGALAIQSNTDPEVVLSGPAETGKTIACLTKLHNLAVQYPGAQLAILRKTYQSTVASVVQSFEKKVLPYSRMQVTKYGGEKPEWFDYENGSRIWIGGMDNPNKALSSERGAIYVNQAEELTLEDWEYLITRTTGREGIVPVPQLFGDCNPGASTHWILGRRDAKMLTFLESRHEDNPRLYTPDGQLTADGKRSMDRLDNLTGIRKQRLRFGRWVSAEGAVYEFDRAIHVVNRFDIPREWRRIRAVDFGYTNPFVCQWWAIDPDGRMYLYREIYHTRRLVEDHATQIRQLTGDERIEVTICDHDAEDRATLLRHGVPTVAAYKAIRVGIEAVQARLQPAGDGKPRLFVFADALIEADDALIEARCPICTEQEFDTYVYPKGQDGRPVKEEPIKLFDHGMDAMRYAVAYENALAPAAHDEVIVYEDMVSISPY